MDDLDPRQRRTRSALRDAILTLSATTPTRQITMVALAREAGLNRSTVYQHVRSPAELLASILLEELDALRDALLASSESQTDAQRTVIHGVLRHLESHRAVYLRELTDPASEVPRMLQEHFETSCRTLLETQVALPTVDPGVAKMLHACAPAWIAAGNVAAMTTWLGLVERDPELYFQAHRVLQPTWWP